MNRQKSEIVCDNCGAIIETVKGLLREREIAKDEDGNDIVEQFFECGRCGQHYTVIVTNRDMRLMIQRRVQLKRRMNMNLKRNGSKAALQKLIDEDRELQEDLKYAADALKEKYLEGGV